MTTELQATQALMGQDFGKHGLEANRDVLEAQIRWSFEQGLKGLLNQAKTSANEKKFIKRTRSIRNPSSAATHELLVLCTTSVVSIQPAPRVSALVAA